MNAAAKSTWKRVLSWSIPAAVLLVLGLAAGAYYWFRLRPPERIHLPSAVKTLAGADGIFQEPFGIAENKGTIYISDGASNKIWKIVGSAAPVVLASGLDTPSGITIWKDAILVADSGSSTIKRVTQDGQIEIVAGVEHSPGYADGPAGQARFNAPIGIAADGDRIYVADTYNDRIRLIENGQVTTLAGSDRGYSEGVGPSAKFDTPCGLAVKAGQILVADSGNMRIRSVGPNGATTTVAGDGGNSRHDGLPSFASFYAPVALSVDRDGNVYIADGNAIRVISGPMIPTVRTLNLGGRGLGDGDVTGARFNRPSGLAVDASGNLLVTDSDNRLVRSAGVDPPGMAITGDQITALMDTPAEFRTRQPARWPYDPPAAKREIAGTLGEIRGAIPETAEGVHFHNGLDIAGGYGETARFIRDEKVLLPNAAQNYGTLVETLRMPSLGYIHVRVGRDSSERPFDDARFQFTRDPTGKKVSVRIPRGTQFHAGEAVGTLNTMDHVHVIAGRSGSEMNALDALILPGFTDSRPPTIENVRLTDELWHPLETKSQQGRIQIRSKTRIVLRAYDQVDGNLERRRLGVYQVGYQLLNADRTLHGDMQWTIRFDRMPAPESIGLVYAVGSKSGATGETVFNYIATNRIDGDQFREDFFDPSTLDDGNYILRVFAGDESGNITSKDLEIEVKK